MKISACVITKNEEKNIGKWLQEMSAIADEMIVVDTGSTDNTVNMAKRAGAKVYHFKWINDFAAAKNQAIEQASMAAYNAIDHSFDWVMNRYNKK